MSVIRATAIALAAMLFFLAPGAVAAPASAWDANDHVRVRVVSAVDAVGERKSVPMGLQFELEPGWKIYWRSPGDAGFPPQPDWSGSDNLADVALSWPAPRRFSVQGLETLGYEDEILLPFAATVTHPGEPLELRSHVRYLACSDICVPYEAKLALALPAGPAEPSGFAHLIDSFAARVPGEGARQGLAISQAILLEGGKDPRIQVEARSDTPFAGPDLFVEAPKDVVFGKPEVALSEGGRRAVLSLRGVGAEPAALDGGQVVLTLADGDRSMETSVPLHFGAPIRTGGEAADTSSLWRILLFALFGGLILNLMPCVLPVLSIKLLSVVSYGGRDGAGVRLGFLATAAGIVTSMLAIAAGLVGVKAAGMSIGWGIQFQQPLFLAFMALVVSFFAFNLFGLFEIMLPQRLADMGLRAGDHPSKAGHFLTGAFATLLATPCSAPFVGTAIGFALSRASADILLVFAMLGVGLSLPYLAVAAFPRLATALPRPGRWMVVLRRILGLALVATAVWLLTVISAQIGREGAVALGGILALIGVVLAIRHLPGSRLGRHAGKVVAMLAVAALALPVVRGAPAVAPATAPAGQWRVFDKAALDRLVASGHIVFVDVTADWCITCQVNKKVVLDTEPVAGWLNSGKVVPMRADWTRPDDEIARFLASFGRYGIPFNAVFGPDAPDGIALPELLTSDRVLEAAVQSGGDRRLVSR